MGSRGSTLLACVGIGAAAFLFLFALVGEPQRGAQVVTRTRADTSVTVHFLAVGDINLGRTVGQRLLQGDTLYPFACVLDTFARTDIVFGNLESNLSDENGETQSPKNNLVFSGPPVGAWALSLAGVRLVSTANNHALDYGKHAQLETIECLQKAGIRFAGTARDAIGLFDPAVVTCRGVRFALFACTDVMNFTDTSWHRYVADADTGKLFPHLRSIRDSVDFVILSYHGGEEYADRPSARSIRFMRSAINAGADLVLGHHPHVPFGIERINGRTIVYSLGNFVFSQPSRYWTQRSFAFAAEIVKDVAGTAVTRFRCLPVRCGSQPQFLQPGAEADSIYERIHMLSLKEMAEVRQ